MTFVAVGLFAIGFAVSWAAGRYVTRGASVVQGASVGICGVAALFVGMADLVETNFIWALGALLIYGLISALIFKSAQSARERAG